MSKVNLSSSIKIGKESLLEVRLDRITYQFHCRIIPYGILQYVIPLEEDTIILVVFNCEAKVLC